MKPRTVSPWLVDVTRYRFKKATPAQVEAVHLRDYCKILVANYAHGTWFEPIWVEVVLRSAHYWIGINQSQMWFTSKPIRVGDLVKFHPINVVDIAPAHDL